MRMHIIIIIVVVVVVVDDDDVVVVIVIIIIVIISNFALYYRKYKHEKGWCYIRIRFFFVVEMLIFLDISIF